MRSVINSEAGSTTDQQISTSIAINATDLRWVAIAASEIILLQKITGENNG